MRSFTITSTKCNAILPRTDEGLSEQEIVLLKDDMGISVRSVANIEFDISWQHTDVNELKQLSNEPLKQICKSYGYTFPNERKDQLIEMVKQGLIMNSITKIEKNEVFLSRATVTRGSLSTSAWFTE